MPESTIPSPRCGSEPQVCDRVAPSPYTEGAVQNDIPGIDADCGGGMACATCHVYVNDEWLDKLPTKEDGEEDMLDMAFEPKQNSRLSCQLTVSDELDGLVVNIPSKQV